MSEQNRGDLPVPPSPDSGANPSVSFANCDHLTEAEIASDEAERAHEELIEDLEQAVVEAAVGWRTTLLTQPDRDFGVNYHRDFRALGTAVDALIATREKAK